MPELRPYQLEAVKAIYGELHYRQSTLRVASTGSGKTVCQAAVVRIHLRRGGQCVLWIAPRGEIIDQGLKTLALWNPDLVMGRDICVEKATSLSHLGAKVVMASIQSLRDERLKYMPTPDLIIADEAHLYFDACGRIFDKWPNAKRIGWTATPDRLDQKKLIPERFESVAAVYELGQAIGEGFLVKPEFQAVTIEGLELDGVPAEGPDFSEDALGREMMRPEVVKATVAAIQDAHVKAPDKMTLVYCVSIEHAQVVTDAINAAPSMMLEHAKVVYGNMPDTVRDKVLKDFRAGDQFNVMVSVDLFTYGLDVPFVNCIVLARPTKSRALYSQMVGRGLRLYPGKKTCLVLDLGANTSRHTLITPEDALRPDYDLVNMAMMSSFDLAPAVAAKIDAEVDADLEEEPPAREALPPEEIRLTLAYRDVTNQLSLIGEAVRLPNPDDPPATEKQIHYLEHFGIDGADTLTTGQASELIDKMIQREKDGWCSVKQAKVLQRASLLPNVTADLAKTAIDAIAANGWRLPGWLLHKHPGLQHTGTATLRVK